MNITKQQHFVPQFYLRQFASDKGCVLVYDKQTGKVFSTAVRNIAGERFFYDSDALDEIVGEKQAM